MTILALYSNKGGVGKTATAVNLAYLAAQSGRKTLLFDLDPQASATFYLRVKPKLKSKARGLTAKGAPIEKSIKGSDYPNLDVLPADFSHRRLDLVFNKFRQRQRRLVRVIAPLEKEYDLIVIDAPPTINLLAENIFEAVDVLLTPIIPTPLSVRTYQQLRAFLRETNAPAPLWAFLSMVDRRKKLQRELASSLPEEIPDLLATQIPYLSLVEQMGIHREPTPAFAPRSRAAEAYRALWLELEMRLAGGEATAGS